MKSHRTRLRMTTKLAFAIVLSLSVQTGSLAFAERVNLTSQSLPSKALTAAAATVPTTYADTQTTLAPRSDGPKDAQEVTQFLDRFFANDAIKRKAGAVSVAVVRDGQVLATKGYGVVDQVSKAPVDPDKTTFRIASVSKIFTATAIMQLVDQGKLSLQDNIEKFLDGYKVKNPFNKPVTIAMLLTHTTGFEVRDPDASNFLFDSKTKPMSLKEATFNNFPSVVREPGTSYMYDNFASRLQGYIVEKVSGESFSDYVTKHVFKPLGMTSSSFTQTDDLVIRLAATYGPTGAANPFYELSPSPLPEGGVITTSSDMARYMNAFLNGGKAADGTVILSADSVKAMSTYHMSINAAVPDTTYGFEAPFLPSKVNGQFTIAKGGDILGFSSIVWFLPDSKTGIFVTYNTNGDLRDDLFGAFMDHYYAGQSTTVGEPGFQQQTQEELRSFEGLYSDLRSSTFITKVTASGKGKLTVFDAVNGQQELTQVGKLLFVDEKSKLLAFGLDPQGKVNYLKYSNPVSYSAKKPAALGFPDITADHPYAAYILSNQSLGLFADDPTKPFKPTDTVSRGTFIHALFTELNVPSSANPSEFVDIDSSPYAAEIQAAKEFGILTGTGSGKFEPERPILREEAAVIVERLLVISGQQPSPITHKLAPGTDSWAISAVNTMLNLKLYGPEVTVTNGVTDFASKRELNKQELAALQYLLLLPQQD
ncbi:hypothetical protein Back11_16530 [Paenibacillus baekrokdamisoli]|uniref:Uncharacterized protein n=1 Tax=Paenibacillus baekrokdamisoli TaxID=1712516 RepID=A0A3G9J8Y0_9BACL|nr:serine hydrolase [Paenibacillus baekrokdamisoli]MBB3072005.1 CubicO group peptidase (beta-lactamase class C family) [Paenibacillus baekrokdamisoli]BBH20308.1 hypothetical protein Back11_16530 [Paenibacillus baekrokdamisoli]